MHFESNGIWFFEKSVIDQTRGVTPTYTVTDGTATDTGESIAANVADRKNTTGWITEGSNDAAGTIFEVDFGQTWDIDSLFMLLCNFGAYQVEYWDGDSWEDFSPVINVTGNTEASPFHQFTEVAAEKVRITISGTITADEDKRLAQLAICKSIGQISAGMEIVRPRFKVNRTVINTLSGKTKVIRSVGGFEFGIRHPGLHAPYDSDLTILETLYDFPEGFLVWLCGNDTSQFATVRRGFRREDLFYVAPTTDLQNPMVEGRYGAGTVVSIDFEEAI